MGWGREETAPGAVEPLREKNVGRTLVSKGLRGEEGRKREPWAVGLSAVGRYGGKGEMLGLKYAGGEIRFGSRGYLVNFP